ncbi:MAG: Flp family type IVb pilin [Parafilimonas terrae]|jgi:pilus assembly protein Flp/PilA|nr:Flp family type IVb pilin [Parafilimonas terrae]
MKTLFSRFASDESGATAIEYGMIASLVAVAIIAGLKILGTNLGAKFNQIATNISSGS